MLDPDLPFASLTGKESVSLTLQYGYYSSPNYVDFDVVLRAPNCTFAVDQKFSTSTYRLSDPNSLASLLDGESNAEFEIDALNFGMTISQLKLGVRTGYLVQLEFSTITPLSHAPWPADDTLVEFMMLETDSIGHLRFAFTCEETEIRNFQSHLSAMHSKIMGATGG